MSTENEGAADRPASDAPVPPPPAERSGADGAAAPRTPNDVPPEDYDLQAPTHAPAPAADDPSTAVLRKIDPDAPPPHSPDPRSQQHQSQPRPQERQDPPTTQFATTPPPPAPARPHTPQSHGTHGAPGAHGAHAPHPGEPHNPWGAPDGGYGDGYGGGTPPPHTPGTTAASWGAPLVPPAPPGPERKRGRFGGLIAAVVAAALLAGGVGAGVGFWAADRANSGTSTTISSDGTLEQVNRPPDSVAGIAAKALPSVVTIEAAGGGESGTGTGFVYDQQGHIMTNNHVVASAADGGDLTATFSDGRKYDAEVVGRAQGYDVAVVKLKDAGGAKLTPLPLGDSDKVQVGDATIAIGAPYGLSGTVTTGIVSAKNRPVASSDGQGAQASYMSAIQTDASINPGNSGGPLLNAEGAVVGINSAIQSAPGGGLGGAPGSIGLGFAIPINQAKRVGDNLIKTGEPVYPVIGVQVVTQQQSDDGARIIEDAEGGDEPVTPGGPADKAGLRAGDVITKFDGVVIDSGPTLISEIWAHEPGEKVTLTYERDGREAQTELTLGSRTGD
ncbi:trypsin-like peptidase domain-containing protein [Streptomyces sp. TRM 70361]|uniref:trypsin-like peptidase domain-containing protein n=1 Tax=Streptomyces sp. TRM 70361 TaxID=3116553 RepID=UPI002E7C54FB|nr:trypsin-like peptidase domain-containing protein [Streptomyces sp. TRM 70361]MEE1939645.1 trypsin-like peptidase domain-containing protein [Streptomyces sp. TRM 70361]